MTSLFELLNGKTDSSYIFGQIISISKNILKIKTITGLNLTIHDNSGNYSVGDQIVLGSDKSNLNSTFIITKIPTYTPNAINQTIDLNSD